MNAVISHMLLAYGLTIVVSMAVAVMIKGMTVAMASLGGDGAAAAKTSAAPAAASKPAPAVTASAGNADDIAAIAAAVHAMLGSHYQIVHIRDQIGTMWTAGGRMMNQSSHNLPRKMFALTPGN